MLHRKAGHGSLRRGRVSPMDCHPAPWSTTMEVTEAWATHPGDLPPYLLSRWLFLRLLGVVYFVAFVSLMVQVPGLVGEHGILPAGAFLQRAHALYGSAAYRLFPTVCWLGSSDGMLRLLCWGGAALALLLIAGVAPAPILLLLWVVYPSLSAAGQSFLWFQGAGLLREAGFPVTRCRPTRFAPP